MHAMIPRRSTAPLVCLLIGVVVAGVPLLSQDAPVAQILSPTADTYATGSTPIRVRVEPADTVTSVAFSVDGRQVCTVSSPPFDCDWDAGPSVVAHQIRIVVSLSGGGRLVQAVRTKALGFAEQVSVDVVQVTATVQDGRGHFVKNLPQSAFHLWEDGRPQTFTHFASEGVSLELIVSVDISTSMTPTVPTLKKAVKEFLGAVPASDHVTLLAFNDVVFPLTRRATDPAERIKAVDRLAPWGATALYDVIIQGVDLLGRQAGRKALVVFTDGEDQGSHATIDDAEQRLQSSDVTLFMIGQGRGVTLAPLKKVMQRLATPTGGRAFFTESVDELHDVFAQLLDELSNQYLLGYPATKYDGAWHTIKVQVDGHHEARARQGYRAPKAK